VVSNVPARFADRRDAGRWLATLLGEYRYEDPIVVGIVPNGLPVAAEIGRALCAPLEAAAVVELGSAERPLGVLAEAGISVIDDRRSSQIPAERLEAGIAAARAELREQVARCYPSGRRLAVGGRTVVLVDDRLTGVSRALAAARSLRVRGAQRVTFAAPVAMGSEAVELGEWVDGVVSLHTVERAEPLEAWYDETTPTAEDEVIALLTEHTGETAREAVIEAEPGQTLGVELLVPWGAYARGVIALPRGPGGARVNARARQLADRLNQAGFATLVLDLLAGAGREQGRLAPACDDALATRLVAAIRWLRRQPETARLPVGILAGDEATAAPALLAAARLRAGVCAVLVCGGRRDGAGPRLREIVAPVRICSALTAATTESGTHTAIEWFTQHLSEPLRVPEPGRVAVV
jgi:putative phosphoribosyl transferase